MANSYGASFSTVGSTVFSGFILPVLTIDFTTSPPSECHLSVTFSTGQEIGGVAIGGKVGTVYIATSLDGTTFSDLGASLLGNTVATENGLVKLSSIYGAILYSSEPTAVSPLFGGALPRKIRVWVNHEDGAQSDPGSVVITYRTETFA